MMLLLEEDHQQIRIAIDQSTWEIERTESMDDLNHITSMEIVLLINLIMETVLPMHIRLMRLPLKFIEFEKSQDSSWNALVTLKKAQCILAGSNPQKNFFFDEGIRKSPKYISMIGAVEGSSYRDRMKDETKTEIQDIVQKIISLEFEKTRHNLIKKQCFVNYIYVNKSRNDLQRVRISKNISSNESKSVKFIFNIVAEIYHDCLFTKLAGLRRKFLISSFWKCIN